jgi:hypothetical protein
MTRSAAPYVWAGAVCVGRTAHAAAKGEISALTSPPASTTRVMPSEKTARMGDKGKAVGLPRAGGFAVCGLILPRELRQLGNVRRNSPDLVFAGQLSSLSALEGLQHVLIATRREASAQVKGLRATFLIPRRGCLLKARSTQGPRIGLMLK